MLWLAIAAALLALVWFIGRRPRGGSPENELGKGHGNSGRARYRNRSSRDRDD